MDANPQDSSTDASGSSPSRTVEPIGRQVDAARVPIVLQPARTAAPILLTGRHGLADPHSTPAQSTDSNIASAATLPATESERSDDGDSGYILVLDAAEPAEAPAIVELVPVGTVAAVPRSGVVRQFVRGLARFFGWIFGAASAIVGLSVMASVPILQFVTLGYLFEAAGRVGRTGRLQEGFPDIRAASLLGRVALGVTIVFGPLLFAQSFLDDSRLIDATSDATARLNFVVFGLRIVTPIHIALALLHGGRLNHFFRPLSNLLFLLRGFARRRFWRERWIACRDFLSAIPLWHYLSFGVRGFLGAGLWLVVPITIMAAGRGNGAVSVLGGLFLLPILLHLPFLEARFATENRFRAVFELREVRERARRAPIAFLLVFTFTLLMALPLYLLKIESIPREAMWLPALVFVVTIFPMKVFAGWAYAWAGRRERRAYWLLRFACRAVMWPIAAFYAFVVFLTQYTGWYGVRSLYEQHAFLLPSPF